MLQLLVQFSLNYIQLQIVIRNTQMSKQKTENEQTNDKKQTKSKSTFIYKNQDDMYLFQNKGLFMKVQFRSPIKQISEYLQHYERYCFLSEISSVGIKATQQKQLYEVLTSSIDRQFKKYLQWTVYFMEEMIMNVHFLKYERWHYYSQIVKGYKNHILNKDIDCYDFNPQQFEPQVKKVLEHLKNIHNDFDSNETEHVKKQIKLSSKQIQKKIGEIHDSMCVKNPFKAQNQRRAEVSSDQLFESYMRKFANQTYFLQQTIDIKFHSSYDGIRKFPQFIRQFSLKGQTIANNIAKQYNQSSANLVNQIYKPILTLGVKKDLQLNDYYAQWKKNEKMTPILRNRIEKVSLSNRIICKNGDTKDTFTVQLPQQTKYILTYPRNQEQDEIFNNRVPANNPYFDFWAHTYDRSRLRKLQLFYEQPKIAKRNLNIGISRDFVNRYRRKVGKQKKPIQISIYYEIISIRQAEENKIWQVKSVFDQISRKSYQIQQSVKKSKYSSQFNTKAEQESKLVQLQKKVEAYKQYYQKYDKYDKDKNEDEILLVKLKKICKDRTYQQYALKFGLKQYKKQVTVDSITRYGIKIPKLLSEVKDISKLQQFLFHFLRQKLFREVEKYKDKQTMALMLNLKPAQQFCNWKTIKRLGELTRTMKKYYIWASEIIKYEEETTVNKQSSSKFTIYAYSDIKNSQSLLFQLKRRLSIKVTGEIIEKYNGNRLGTIESVISKFQLMNRLLFNQHIETPNSDFSFKKGQQIYNLMVKQLCSEANE